MKKDIEIINKRIDNLKSLILGSLVWILSVIYPSDELYMIILKSIMGIMGIIIFIKAMYFEDEK